MTKNILQDIMTKERRSIRHVPLPHKGRGDEEIDEDILYEREEFQVTEPPSSSSKRALLWGTAFLFLILLGVALSTSFTGATVKVTPKTRQVSVNQELTAERAEGAAFRFIAMPISETAETTLPADTLKRVSERATGTIVIYNNFSEKPQRLIKNTRFETKDGLIYRIASSVTIPGKTIKGGKVLPGSLEAAVTADSPGAEYNIPLSDFTIPGFKTDAARFAGFYARSKTPIGGGFDGTVKVPSEAALSSARAALRKTLSEKIVEEKLASVPQGHILFPGAIAANYESLPSELKDGTLSRVKEKVTGAAYYFRKNDIAREIAKSEISGFDNLPIEILDFETLAFEFKELPGGEPAEAQTLRFTLKGSAKITWLYDEDKLRLALAGKPRDELSEVLSDFPTIEKADFIIRPFWSRSFPRNSKKVSIEQVPAAAR